MVFGQQNSTYDLSKEEDFYVLKDNSFCCKLCPLKKYSHLKHLRTHLRDAHRDAVYGIVPAEDVLENVLMEGKLAYRMDHIRH